MRRIKARRSHTQWVGGPRPAASQGVNATSTSGRLVIVDGFNDTLTATAPLIARNVSEFNGHIAQPEHRNGVRSQQQHRVSRSNTAKESSIGNVQLPAAQPSA